MSKCLPGVMGQDMKCQAVNKASVYIFFIFNVMFCFGSFLFLAKHRCAQNLEISGNLGDVKLPYILHNHNHADINLQKYFSFKKKKKATPPKLGLIFSVGWFPLLGIFGEANFCKQRLLGFSALPQPKNTRQPLQTSTARRKQQAYEDPREACQIQTAHS